jgi:hypothetical protein
VSRVSDFIEEIDRHWRTLPSEPRRTRLRIIGSAALMLRTGHDRGTKDSDVLETASVTPSIKERLLALAGPATALHIRHKMYLDIVASGLPFLPQAPICHALAEPNRDLKHFELEVLDVADIVVSKLKRFSANDASDIRAMVDGGHIDHDRLVERFRAAVDAFSTDARAEDLPVYVKNLNRVERDYFLVAESQIDLPSWIG